MENTKYQIIGQEKHWGIKYQDKEICDITDDKAALERLIDEMNSLELSPIHMMEVIEDFLIS